jgi:hypothetical protein
LLAAGGIAVIWSTLVAVMDAVPRILDRLWHELRDRGDDSPSRYRAFLAVQVGGAAAVLGLFLGDFATFIDVAAGLTFIIAPAVAFFNQRAVALLKEEGLQIAAGRLGAWNGVSIAAFVLFALAFFGLRLV